MVLFLLESVVKLFLFFKEDLIEVEGGRRLGQGLGLVNAVVALLLAEFQFVPFDIRVRDEQFLCGHLHVLVRVVGAF